MIHPARVDLARLTARLPPRPLTRFAPSPTGHLHLGHAVNAIYVWGLARALGGRVLLRIEDHDRVRSRPEYERAILEDLDWLGLEPDAGLSRPPGSNPVPQRQSDMAERYERAIAALRARGLVYVCECTRRSIASAAGHRAHRETPYPGRCRQRALSDGPDRGLRLVLAPGLEPFDDARMGPLCQDPAAQCGDLLARDRHGHWTYQFAVTVDDHVDGVDLVIRGEDLLESTGRQIQLARLLGRATPPVFCHHPLLRGPAGEKLSKANHDTGLRELRAAGWSAGDVLGRAAHACGLTGTARPVTAGDLRDLVSNND
jgi:glutamyl/glutaminyl-tRNA synthetase